MSLPVVAQFPAHVYRVNTLLQQSRATFAELQLAIAEGRRRDVVRLDADWHALRAAADRASGGAA